MAPFIDYIKFSLWNLNINNLMLIKFNISLITKRFLQSFDSHSDKTVTLSELLPNINKFRNKILNFFQKVSQMWLLNCSSYCDTCLEAHYFFKKCPPVNSYRSSSSTDRWTESTFLYSLHPVVHGNIKNGIRQINRKEDKQKVVNIEISMKFRSFSLWLFRWSIARMLV